MSTTHTHKFQRTYHRKFWAGLFIAALVSCAPQSTGPDGSSSVSQQAQNTAPILMTQSGAVRGRTVKGGVHGPKTNINVFQGVRYGATTKGKRFQRSTAPAPWTTAKDASGYSNDCPQAKGGSIPLFASWNNPHDRSEDCLFLNVWTRGLSDGKKRPIMVWMHGGGYSAGSGSSPGYDGANLAARGDVVVVTINHRLNAFGYLHLADLSDDPKYADAGNVGSLDTVLALQWVRDNADAIGGDAGNVTIFGESGGASKVTTLMAMPEADGLFHRVIAQSGSMSLKGFSTKIGTKIAADIVKTAGLEAGQIDALAAMPMDDFIKTILASRGRGGYIRPIVDGRSQPRHPFHPDAPKQSSHIPLLLGTNQNEMRLQGGLMSRHNFALAWDEVAPLIKPYIGKHDPQAIIDGMRKAHPQYTASDVFFQVATYRNYRSTSIRQAERKAVDHQNGGAPVYMYRLDWQTPVDGGVWKTLHALDIGLVFDNIANSVSMTGQGPDQQKMADLMSDAWISFARSGNPQTKALPNWSPYTLDKRGTMIFNLTPKLVNDPDRAERLLLEKLPQGRGL